MNDREKKTKFVIFDFDNTITGQHLHNACMSYINDHISKFPGAMENGQFPLSDAQIDELWNHLEKFGALKTAGDAGKWREIFSHLIDQDHHVFIASNNAFEPILRKFMEKFFDTDKEKLSSKINYRVYYVDDLPNKNQQIDSIVLPRDDVPEKDKYRNVVFIDDTAKNRIAAANRGATVVDHVVSGSPANADNIYADLSQRGLLKKSLETTARILGRPELKQTKGMRDIHSGLRGSEVSVDPNQMKYAYRALERENPGKSAEMIPFENSKGEQCYRVILTKIMNPEGKGHVPPVEKNYTAAELNKLILKEIAAEEKEKQQTSSKKQQPSQEPPRQRGPGH